MRVNVDSKALADGRFKKLGRRLGISWFEALGRCLPVWHAAYEARSPIAFCEDVDALAEREGFADAMVGAELAEATGDGRMRLMGVEERIEFLLIQDAKRVKARHAKLKAAGIDRVPADQPRGPGGLSRGTVPGDVPDGGSRTGAYSPDLDLDHALAPPAGAHAIPGNGARYVAPPTDVHARARGQLADRTWDRMNQIREALASEHGWTDVHPLSDQMRGHRDLRDRIRESGADAERLCGHVLAVLEAEARRDKSVQWLSGKSFTEGGWQRAVAMRVADVNARPGGARANPMDREPQEVLKP